MPTPDDPAVHPPTNGPVKDGDDPTPAPGSGFAGVDEAAAAALARARQAARDRGLRPGIRPKRRVRRNAQGLPVKDTGGRDPELFGEQVQRLLGDRGWQGDVAAGSVTARWADIVGPEVAEHAKPVSFTDGILTVRTESSAWATQLTLLTSQLLGRIATEVGPDVVTELRILGPGAPSWVRGVRRVKGRGPRDTYN